MSKEDKQKKRIHERIQEKSFQQCIEGKIKESNELKNVEVDAVTNFIKDEAKGSSYVEICTHDDDDDSEEGSHWI